MSSEAGTPARARPARRARALSPPPPEEERDALRVPPALRLLNVGYGNLVAVGRVVAVVSASSAPMRRLREEAAGRGKLVDATQGRRTRSIVVTDSDHVVLSALNPETLASRLGAGPGTEAGP